jgi:hypothetical protein
VLQRQPSSREKYWSNSFAGGTKKNLKFLNRIVDSVIKAILNCGVDFWNELDKEVTKQIKED